MPDGWGQPAPELAIQFQDECFGLRPVAKACSWIEMTHLAHIEQFTAPAFSQASDGVQAGEGVVGTGGHQAAERQWPFW